MKLIAKPAVHNFRNSDFVALFLSEEYDKEIDSQIIPELSFIKERADISSFKGKMSESIFIPYKSFPNIIIIGTGKQAKITKESLRENASVVEKVCKKRNAAKVHLVLPVLKNLDEPSVASAIAEGISLSSYTFDKYKSFKEEDEQPSRGLDEVHLYCNKPDEAASILKEIEVISESVRLCRDLINESSEVTNPVAIAKQANALSKLKGIECKVYNRLELEKMKMGLLLAVSRGSVYPPQLAVIKYKGNPKSKKQIALIGKGITYDSGGMNLKPSAAIEDMRSDMAGAAACLYAVRAAALLKLKKNIVAVLPLCENMIGNKAFRAGDVFTSYSGKNVEVGNTDAEGRLILADAIAFTEKVLKPSYIIDVATLTGACLVCFGELIAALLSNDDNLADSIFKAGEETGEKVWRLPLDREYDELIKSDIADIKNVGQGRNAGTIVGATFLKKFVKEVPWAHIDIAGTAWYSKARGYKPKYATGFGIRLFIELIKTLDI